MADSLTQLQDCLDQLATQMFASVNYINSHHENAPIRGQEWRDKWPNALGTVDGTSHTAFIDGVKPATTPTPGTPAASRAQSQGPDELGANIPPRPDSPTTFNEALRELSRDLVMKEQQIEFLINSLPGIDTSQSDQEARIKELEVELKTVEDEVAEAAKVKEELIARVDNVIARVRRV